MALNDIQFFFLVVVETIHAKVTRENERTNEKKYPYRENVKREKNAHLYYTMPYDDGMSASMSLPLNRVQRWKYIEQIPCSFARYKWINSRLIFFCISLRLLFVPCCASCAPEFSTYTHTSLHLTQIRPVRQQPMWPGTDASH